MSIRQNIEYGCTLRGSATVSNLRRSSSAALVQAALWDEVKDRLGELAIAAFGRTVAATVPGACAGVET